MSLVPLDVSPKPQGEEGAPQSFRDRKLSQLHSEVEPVPGTPKEPIAESEEDGYPDEDLATAEFEDNEGDAEIEGEEAEIDSDAELEESEEAEEDERGETIETLRAEKLKVEQALSRVTENRKKIEQDFSDGIAANTRLKFDLEDTIEQQKAQGQVWLHMANQQVQKYENLNWSQVPPEKLGAYKQQATQAMNQRDQIMQVYSGLEEKSKQARELAKDREAEVSRNWLSTNIPNWGNELYSKLGEHATSLGYSAEDFQDITDFRIMNMIHKDFEKQQAVSKVQRVKTQQKARAPRNRNGRPQPKNAKGRFTSARKEAFSKPGDKESFREMKLRQMQAERGRGEGR